MSILLAKLPANCARSDEVIYRSISPLFRRQADSRPALWTDLGIKGGESDVRGTWLARSYVCVDLLAKLSGIQRPQIRGFLQVAAAVTSTCFSALHPQGGPENEVLVPDTPEDVAAAVDPWEAANTNGALGTEVCGVVGIGRQVQVLRLNS